MGVDSAMFLILLCALPLQNQVGSLVMEILDLELRRCEHWEQKEGVPAADVCAKQRQDEALSAR